MPLGVFSILYKHIWNSSNRCPGAVELIGVCFAGLLDISIPGKDICIISETLNGYLRFRDEIKRANVQLEMLLWIWSRFFLIALGFFYIKIWNGIVYNAVIGWSLGKAWV